MFRPLTAEVFESWPVPNYTDPIRRGPELYVVTGTFLSLATICLVARLYSRIFIRRYFGPDDWLICFGYVCAVGVSACSILGNVRYGWDRHIWDVWPTDLSPGIQNLYAVRIFWGLATSAVRLSICCLYYRLLARVHSPPAFRFVLHAFTGFTIGLSLVYVFTTIFPCTPIHAYWSLAPVTGQRCDNDPLVMEIAAVLNTLSEFIIASLPIVAVYKLRIDPAQRWSVIGLLSLSFFVALAGCFRTYFLWRCFSAKGWDMSWWASPHFMSSEIEIYISITSACAAPLRPFVSYVYRRAQGLPSRTPRAHMKHPSFSTSASKRTMSYTQTPYDHESPMRLHYFDIEGLTPNDGYGYTVTISGPAKPRRYPSRVRLRRKESVLNESQQHVLTAPNRTYPHGQTLGDIETTREVEVTESFHPPRSSEDWERAWHSKLKAVEAAEVDRPSIQKDRSWYKE